MAPPGVLVSEGGSAGCWHVSYHRGLPVPRERSSESVARRRGVASLGLTGSLSGPQGWPQERDFPKPDDIPGEAAAAAEPLIPCLGEFLVK